MARLVGPGAREPGVDHPDAVVTAVGQELAGGFGPGPARHAAIESASPGQPCEFIGPVHAGVEVALSERLHGVARRHAVDTTRTEDRPNFETSTGAGRPARASGTRRGATQRKATLGNCMPGPCVRDRVSGKDVPVSPVEHVLTQELTPP